MFRFLHYGLAILLIMVGLKMLTANHLHIPLTATLAAIALVLIVSIVSSMAIPAKAE